MEDLQIVFDPYAGQEQKDVVVTGINFHNVAATGHAAYYPVGVYLRDAQGEVMGGLLGEIWGRWLNVTYLWVAEPARGGGYASRLLQTAERYAIERGCQGAFLATFTFQARPFYEKRGYRTYGVLEDYPPGHQLFLMQKRLDHA